MLWDELYDYLMSRRFQRAPPTESRPLLQRAGSSHWEQAPLTEIRLLPLRAGSSYRDQAPTTQRTGSSHWEPVPPMEIRLLPLRAGPFHREQASPIESRPLPLRAGSSRWEKAPPTVSRLLPQQQVLNLSTEPAFMCSLKDLDRSWSWWTRTRTRQSLSANQTRDETPGSSDWTKHADSLAEAPASSYRSRRSVLPLRDNAARWGQDKEKTRDMRRPGGQLWRHYGQWKTKCEDGEDEENWKLFLSRPSGSVWLTGLLFWRRFPVSLLLSLCPLWGLLVSDRRVSASETEDKRDVQDELWSVPETGAVKFNRNFLSFGFRKFN